MSQQLELVEQQQAHVVVLVEELEDHQQPCFHHRRDGVTVIVADPRCPMEQAVAWSIDNLTVPERNACRVALGQPRVEEGPLTPAVFDHNLRNVPPALRPAEEVSAAHALSDAFGRGEARRRVRKVAAETRAQAAELRRRSARLRATSRLSQVRQTG